MRRTESTEEEKSRAIYAWYGSLTKEESDEWDRLGDEESRLYDLVPCCDDPSKCPIGVSPDGQGALECYAGCRQFCDHEKVNHAKHVFECTHGKHTCDLCVHRDALTGTCREKRKFRSPVAEACEKFWLEEI